MKKINYAWILLAGIISCQAAFSKVSNQANPTNQIVWQEWSNSIFDKAKNNHKYILLDLEAVWCHWCHVMDKDTYSNPEVISLINSKFIPVRADQDARPDLSNRYQDYGWPATIIFDSTGAELSKRSGYIPSDDMASLLKQIIKSPKPEASASKPISSASNVVALSPSQRKILQTTYFNSADMVKGGLKNDHKFLDADSVEYAMIASNAGNSQAEQIAKKTLNSQKNLIDPLWGGVYQYSTDSDWQHPHFEKIMQIQADNMRIYSLAYEMWHDPSYLRIAQDINRYLTSFLMSPAGAFYTSQDADLVAGQHSAGYFKLSDVERRKLGIPRVDKHQYARENGWVINGLTALYAASGNKQYLEEAKKAALWIIANRQLPAGGFRHDVHDVAGPYLGDTLSMGAAFLNLYGVTADRLWLAKAQQAADFISKNFACKTCSAVGFVTAKPNNKNVLLPQPTVDENVAIARFANLLYSYSGNKLYKQMAESAMSFLASPNTINQYDVYVAGPLLADIELKSEPLHITVVGSKSDPAASQLFASAIAYPRTYKRVDWFDSSEGSLPNTDVQYPHMNKPAAFVCANGRCSLPAFDTQRLSALIERFSKP